MKKITTLAIFLFPMACLAQSKEVNENDFILKKSTNINGLTIKNYYFQLKNVVELKGSFTSTPKRERLQKIADVGMELRSDSFTVEKSNKLLYTAAMSIYPKKTLRVTDLSSKTVKSYPFDLQGELTANRAIELVQNGYDKKNGKTEGGYLYFDQKKYKIIENDDIQKKLLELIIPAK